jgi:heptaprenyl diphosphate synthase
MKTSKLVTLALLTAVSLVLFAVEMQIPPLTPLPGIKLGLANTVSLYVLYRFKAGDALIVVIARVLLAAFVTGNPSALLFSLTGGIAAVLIMAAARSGLGRRGLIPAVSVTGAAAHNVTQIAVAVIIYGSTSILLHLPAMILGGILSGLLTGFVVMLVIRRGI